MALLSRITRFLMPHAVPKLPATPCYELSDESMFACGSERECHVHPDDPDRCIKVARYSGRENAQEQSLVEWYCAMTLEHRGISFRHCAHCYGWTATSRGPGLVVERIRNDDGQPSLTMRQYANTTGTTATQLEAMIAELKQWSFENGVPIVETSGANVMVRSQAGQPHFVFVDGIGGRKVKLKMILYRRIPWFGRLRARNRWPRQASKIHEHIATGSKPGK